MPRRDGFVPERDGLWDWRLGVKGEGLGWGLKCCGMVYNWLLCMRFVLIYLSICG